MLYLELGEKMRLFMNFFENIFQIPFYSQPQTMEMGRGVAKRMFRTFWKCV